MCIPKVSWQRDSFREGFDAPKDLILASKLPVVGLNGANAELLIYALRYMHGEVLSSVSSLGSFVVNGTWICLNCRTVNLLFCYGLNCA